MAAGRDVESVHLSLLEFLAHVLPPYTVPVEDEAPLTVQWDVQPARREPQTRPLCVCQPVGPSPSSGTGYVREIDQPFEVLAYPLGVEGSARGAQRQAQAVKQLLLRAFDSGAGTGRNRGYAMRVPLFDFTGVGDDEELPVDATPIDYLVIQALSADARQDPEQDDLWTVMLDFRVNWRDDGDRSRFEGTTLDGVTLTQLPPAQDGP